MVCLVDDSLPRAPDWYWLAFADVSLRESLGVYCRKRLNCARIIG